MIQGSDIQEWTLVGNFAIRTQNTNQALTLAHWLKNIRLNHKKGDFHGLEWMAIDQWRKEHG